MYSKEKTTIDLCRKWLFSNSTITVRESI